MTYVPKNLKSCPIRAIDNMGSTLSTPKTLLDRLCRLTPREKEICILHFIEARSQELISEWLGLSPRHVRRHLLSALAKIPELEPLRVKSLVKPERPKILHLSQLRNGERGPFNTDEL